MHTHIAVMIPHLSNNDNPMLKYTLKLIPINNRGKCCWSVWFAFFCVSKTLKRHRDAETQLTNNRIFTPLKHISCGKMNFWKNMVFKSKLNQIERNKNRIKRWVSA